LTDARAVDARVVDPVDDCAVVETEDPVLMAVLSEAGARSPRVTALMVPS
jgi:hypothetical protein